MKPIGSTSQIETCQFMPVAFSKSIFSMSLVIPADVAPQDLEGGKGRGLDMHTGSGLIETTFGIID